MSRYRWSSQLLRGVTSSLLCNSRNTHSQTRLLACKRWTRPLSTSCSGATNGRVMDKKVALVTGSTSGIGLGIAHSLASRGCAVILNGFGDDELIESLKKEFATKYNSTVNYLYADLTQASEIQNMWADIKKLYPEGIDILVNNAGFQHVCPVEEFPVETWDKLLSLMLSAPFHLIKHSLPDMRKKEWGRIVNVSSVHGLRASPNKCAYVTAKHGLMGLTKGIALETAGSGVTSNAVCPGYVETPILKFQVQNLADKDGLSYEEAKGKFLANFHPSKQAVGVDQIAEAVAFLCSDAASQMTGSSIVMDGGWAAK